jgi:type IV pilus assembly protein PilX
MLLTPASPSCHNQRGVALIMALVFLTLLTLIGVTAMSTTSLEEKMATNTRDRNLAFQAAETALLAAETWMAGLASEPGGGTWADATRGRYDFDPAAIDPIWETNIWDGTNIVAYPCTPDDTTPSDSTSCVAGTKTEISKVARQPRYVVEKMGVADATVPNTFAYRITARGTGSSNAAVVMLQATYVRAFP